PPPPRGKRPRGAPNRPLKGAPTVYAKRFFKKAPPLDACRIKKPPAVGADHPLHPAAHDDFRRHNVAIDRCVLSDDKLHATNVALDLAINLNVALTLEIALHGQPGIDH